MPDTKPPKTPSSPEAKTSTAAESGDVALICGVSEDRRGVDIVRRRGDTVEVGTVRPLVPGKPLAGEVVRLKPRKGTPLLCDVEVEWDARSATSAPGPAQVSNDNYRRGWDAIYQQSGKAPSKELN